MWSVPICSTFLVLQCVSLFSCVVSICSTCCQIGEDDFSICRCCFFFSFAGRCALSATVKRTFFITWICKELQLSKNKLSCEIRLLALWLVIFVGVHQHMHLQMCIFHYFAYGTYNAADSWKSALERLVPYECISMASTKLTTSRGKPANNSSRINKT